MGLGDESNGNEINESKDIELQITIPEDAEYELHDLTIILTAGDVTETLELTIDVTDNPTNYEVEISVVQLTLKLLLAKG